MPGDSLYLRLLARGGALPLGRKGPRFAVFFAACVMASFAASAADLTEREAIDLALARSAYRNAEAARIGIAKSAVTDAGLWPNPTLGVERERVRAAGGHNQETSVKLSQTFDLSGRRQLRREAAETRLDAARFDLLDQRQRTVLEVRRAFADALYKTRQQARLAAWMGRIDSAIATVDRLSRAGEASGYDRRRLEREALSVRSQLLAAEADVALAMEQLAGFLGNAPAAEYRPIGNLVPDAPPPLEGLRETLRQRPDLASFASQSEAFDRERRAAERQWIPDITLGVGQKRAEEQGRDDYGVILSLSIPLSVFDRGQAEEQRARAHAKALRSERELTLTKAEANLRGVWRQAVSLRDAALRLRPPPENSGADLSSIAEAAYRTGERTIVELLDAYRAELDADMNELDLQMRARLARIDLDALTGTQIHE